MIAHLKGTLLKKMPASAILDVNGVGYQVFIPLTTYYELPELGDALSFFIHTHVREDALKLYGFLSEDDKNIFETLIGVNKVGPKLALTILSGLSAQGLAQAVSAQDVARLNAIPGVGSKTAERLVLELKDKLAPLAPSPGTPAASNGVMSDALSALINLGYKRPAAEQALKTVWQNGPASLENLIKESLNILS
ncbi:MAG: Holliday junction branch migration protein RuvA [Nitrospina sp.]|nr:MAG: Holliday junction branch migration protein RuvA [Nitrospina sp.]TDJ61416.1 MAG: Holliday junction branch migration protein RuvA [Nitrospina sp.]